MFCSKCGKEIKQGAKFCSFCGNPIAQASETNRGEKVNVVPEVKQPSQEDDKTLLLDTEENQVFTQNMNSMSQQVQEGTSVINMETLLEEKPKKKQSGLGGLIILLICLVIVAGGCLFAIFFFDFDDADSKAGNGQSDKKGTSLEEMDTDEENSDEVTTQEEDAEEAEAAQEAEAVQEQIDYMEKAQEAYDAAEYTLAIQCCEMAIQEDNGNVEAYSTKALAFLKQDDYELAADTLYEGIEATNSNELKDAREQLVSDVTKVSCEQFNSLGVLIGRINYDMYGNAIQYTHYSDGVNVSAIEEYSYDSAGECTRMVQYDGNGNMQWQENYSYDNVGNMVYAIRYNSQLREEWTDIYSYDRQGRKVALERYNADGTLSWWDEYAYVDDENMTKTAHPSDGSTSLMRCKQSFDVLGNQTGYEEYDSSGKCTYSWTKEYNGLGDETVYLYGDSTVNYVYDYQYNP